MPNETYTYYHPENYSADNVKVSENGHYHIYFGMYFTEDELDESGEPTYWVWNDRAWEESDPDSANEEPWTFDQVREFFENLKYANDNP